MKSRQISVFAVGLALATSAAWSLSVHAAGSSAAHGAHGHGAQGHDHGRPASAHPAGAQDLASGEVRRLDRAAGKLTLRHGEIPNLDMPPMTMVFEVADPSRLDSLKVGDKIKFRAEKSATGFVVTAIEPVKH